MILILRAALARRNGFAKASRNRSLEWLEIPMLRLQSDKTVLEDIVRATSQEGEGRDWLVFTSGNAVHLLSIGLKGMGLWETFIVHGGKLPIAAMGPKTAETLSEEGLKPSLLSPLPTPASLAESMEEAGIARAFWPCNSSSERGLARALENRGVKVVEYPFYDEIEDKGSVDEVFTLLKAGHVQALGFTSPNVVRAFIGAMTSRGLTTNVALGRIPVGTIGPSTVKALANLGVCNVLVSDTPNTFELVQVLAKAL